MKKEKYDEVIAKLGTLSTKKEKKEYLLMVIEETDYDNNGWNQELINEYNKLNHNK